MGQCEAKRHPVTSGPAWCLAIDKEATTMAVGTEEGCVVNDMCEMCLS